LAIPASPSPQLTPDSALRKESSSSVPRVLPSSSAPTSSRKIDPNLKRQMIADLRRQTDFVLGQVRGATGNFREIDRLDQVKTLPPVVSAHVTLLANQALQFRATLGYEVAYYECLAEIQAVDALVVVDEATRNLAAKDAPSARTTLLNFTKRYSEPAAAEQKPLWRYLVSVFSLCDRLKNEAQGHLPRALSLETSGKKSEALQELREVYRIYPNPLTAEKIKQLQAQLR
jgi:hypothetical protein